MNKRNLALIAGVLAIGLVAASILGGQQMTATAQEQPTQSKPTVSTSGSSSVHVDPDKVSVNIGVETNGATAGEAAATNAKLMEKVISALRSLSIKQEQISTSNYSVYPVYEWKSPPCIEIYPQPPECAPKNEITGYRATNMLTVTVDASANVGAIIDAAVASGANNVSGAYFFLSEERQQEIRDGLIEKAITNARSRADKAAAAVDMDIVGVQSISLNDVYFPVFYKDFAESSGGTQILPGQQVVSTSVQVVFVMG